VCAFCHLPAVHYETRFVASLRDWLDVISSSSSLIDALTIIGRTPAVVDISLL